MGKDQWTKGLKILSGGIAQNHSRQVDGVRGKETHDYITVSHRCLYSFEGQAGGQARGQAINGHTNSVPEQFLLCLQPKALQ